MSYVEAYGMRDLTEKVDRLETKIEDLQEKVRKLVELLTEENEPEPDFC